PLASVPTRRSSDLAGVERMRGRADLDLDQRVLVAVLPLHGLLAGERGTGEDLEVRGHVLEDDFAVLGMDVGLHGRAPGYAGKERHYSWRLSLPQASPRPGWRGPAARTRPGRSGAGSGRRRGARTGGSSRTAWRRGRGSGRERHRGGARAAPTDR